MRLEGATYAAADCTAIGLEIIYKMGGPGVKADLTRSPPLTDISAANTLLHTVPRKHVPVNKRFPLYLSHPKNCCHYYSNEQTL